MVDFRINRFFAEGGTTVPSRRPVLDFHRGLAGYAETPLHVLPGLAGILGIGRLMVKDESQRFGLEAFKALGASWAVQRIREGRTGPMTVTTATAGNHGRAVAWAARRLGCEAVVFIPAHAAPARIEKIRAEGARVELVHGTYDDAVARAEDAGRRQGWQVVADIGYPGYLEIPKWIAEGYATLFEEIGEQLARDGTGGPDLVLIQAGVGSLLHAAVDHFRGLSPQPELVAVEPWQSDPHFVSAGSPGGEPTVSPGAQDSIMAGLNCGEVSLSAWPTNRRGVNMFLVIEDRHAAEAMRRLARPVAGDPAIVAGESGAAGLGGLLALLTEPALEPARQHLRLGPASRVLVVNTEGATDPVGYERIVRGEM
ncbi:MAG TPA: diaminopropionate ammonia-lyase [Gemmatimonadales bacterium]|nr:diaminopropionate ammonia-lyase [Gemmatimonadales bacterium]